MKSVKHQAALPRIACGDTPHPVRRWLARSRPIALGVIVALAVPVERAKADVSAQQKAAAEALFEEANKLMEEGQYGAACERFEQSQKADPGVGTLLNLGRCYALTGRLASAWAIYREAASAARASGQGDRARMAEENARELRPKLSELALLVPAGQPRGYELLMDGNLVSSVQFGLSVPVDAGQHSLVARAPGHEQWSSVIQIGGGGAHKTVQVPALAPLALDTPASAAPPAVFNSSAIDASSAGTGSPVADLGSTESGQGQRLAGMLVAGGGVLVIGGGVAMGLHANSVNDDAKKSCGPQGCYDPKAEELNQSARNWAMAANISYVVGALALGTGAYLYFTAHDEPAKAAHSGDWQLVPVLGSTPGVLVDGKF